jgi:pimeloyl-ACP methyl ester carboxylesterase
MGWSTKGFEWVSPIVELSHRQIPIWFFKYDWDECPENSADYLYRETEKLIGNNSHLDSLWIIGHSLGGVVTSLFAEKWDRDFPITIHSIAAPLAGVG